MNSAIFGLRTLLISPWRKMVRPGIRAASAAGAKSAALARQVVQASQAR